MMEEPQHTTSEPQQPQQSASACTSSKDATTKREDSLSVVGVELIDSMAANPFVDRVFKTTISMLFFLLLSGFLWCISKIDTSLSNILEQIAVTVFILTLVLFAVSGLIFMCSILLIGATDKNEAKAPTIQENS